MSFSCSSLSISLLLWVLPSIRSLADCCPLLEVADMILMGNRPDPLCVFTYVQALCHHLSKIEKERKDKEEEKKSTNEREILILHLPLPPQRLSQESLPDRKSVV